MAAKELRTSSKEVRGELHSQHQSQIAQSVSDA